MVKTRRLAVGAIAVFAATGMALAGCGNGNHSGNGATGNGSAGSSLTPQEVVLASSKQLKDTTYKMSITADGITGTGQADPAHKKIAMDLMVTEEDTTLPMSMIIIDKDVYMKIDMSSILKDLGDMSGDLGDLGDSLEKFNGDTWLHVDASAAAADLASSGLGGGFGDIDQSDPLGAGAVFGGATDITKIDKNHYHATVDPSKLADKGFYSDFAKDASSVPADVDITIDDQGRLTDLKVTMQKDGKPWPMEMKFSDFGAPVDIKKPDHVTEMGDMSSLFGGQGN